MGALSLAVAVALSGVSCLSVSKESRMVVPQVQSEKASADINSGATFTPKEIQIPGKTDAGLDEPVTHDAVSPDGEGSEGRKK